MSIIIVNHLSAGRLKICEDVFHSLCHRDGWILIPPNNLSWVTMGNEALPGQLPGEHPAVLSAQLPSLSPAALCQVSDVAWLHFRQHVMHRVHLLLLDALVTDCLEGFLFAKGLKGPLTALTRKRK